jgi:D-amino-acid dehydrogenase
MSNRGTVLVIGGGVVGAACAYHLVRDGWKVTLVDRGVFGMGCSHANCGFVSPSHVLPLAAPGGIAQGLKALFSSGGPLSIRLRFDPALWGWLLRFARRCNRRDMIESAHGIQALLNSSRKLYDEMIRDEGIACEWQTRGMLFVIASQAGMNHFAETNHLLAEGFDMPAKRYDGDALNQLEPALKPGLAGGWYYEGDAHLRPDRLMDEMRRVLTARGVTIHENCAVQGIVREGEMARAATTSRGAMPAEAFVVATGAWTPRLNKQLGCSIPIQPGKGYSITMPRPGRCPAIPLIFEEHRVAVTPMQSGYRIGSTMEFAGYDSSLNRKRLEMLRTSAALYLHEPTCEPVEEEWYGWRPMTTDSKPIIGFSPKLENLVIAAGHNMLGLSMAPATGKLVAELLDGRTPHVDPRAYAATRF